MNIITSTSPLSNTEVVVVEHQKPQGLARSRSARQSRELDINPEALLDQSQTPSYTKMLLQDIQNFHQKSVNPISLPACVTKACSIVEAVADLNSTTSSNFSCAFSEDRSNPPTYHSSRNEYTAPYSSNLVGKSTAETREPFVESEVAMDDDILEPSFHKYVTVRRGGPVVSGGGGDTDDQESSGSNSFVGSVQQQPHWGVSTASWEPNSADSTDTWTSRQNTREEGHPHHGSGSSLQSKSGLGGDETRRRTTERRRETDSQRNGIGRGRLGSAGKVHTIPVAATGSI